MESKVSLREAVRALSQGSGGNETERVRDRIKSLRSGGIMREQREYGEDVMERLIVKDGSARKRRKANGRRF